LLGGVNVDAEFEARSQLKAQIALRQASTMITSSLDLSEVLYSICEQLCLVVDATSTYILNLDFESKKAEVIAEYISDNAIQAELKSDLGAVYEETDTRYLAAMEIGEPWVDMIDDSELPENDRLHLEEYGGKSVVYIPMKVGSRIVGTAEIWESRRNRVFSADEIALCQSLAQNAAIAIENARLFEQTRQEVAERSLVEAELRESEERYSLAALGANDGLWDWDLDNDQIYYSARWKEILGYEAHEINGDLQEWFKRIHREDLVEVQVALSAHLEGVSDHALFLDRLDRIIEQSQRNEQIAFAVLFLDIDRFKNINDRFGHLVGDKMLITIGERLQASTRFSDTVARLGGDEFVILLESIEDLEEVTLVAARIQNEISQAYTIDGRELFSSCSIGVIMGDESYHNSSEFLRDADIAMYRAKSDGRARYVVFNSDMRTELMNKIWMENDLRRAIRNDEFCLHYQPILSLKTSRLVGFEALIRWMHPTEGLVAPMQFIPVAEETRLIIPVGRWVLQEACKQLLEWDRCYQGEEPLTMSINISGVQLNSLDFVDQVQQILSDIGLNPSRIILEITESMIVEEDQIAAGVISELRDLGVRVHLDDFGTGYSALSYLQSYPIDILKIDRGFIGKINGNGENIEIIKAILNLARDLNMGVIAEGIETQRQYELLKGLNCQYGQGFFIAKPMDHEAIEKLLESNFFELSE
jgi:diguanylate cyclase (GGDEF)-like protein